MAKGTAVVSERPAEHKLPIATITVIAITAIITTLQFFYPALLPALNRNLDALRAGQWWRLITPRFVQPDIWPQYILLAILAVIGTAVEWGYGSLRWLMLWLTGSVIGEAVSFAWDPVGAGASLGICGVLGGLLVLLLRREDVDPWPAVVVALAFIANLIGVAAGSVVWAGAATALVAGLLIQLRRHETQWCRLLPVLGAIGLLGGLILIALRDQHGPPLLAGAALATLFLLLGPT